MSNFLGPLGDDGPLSQDGSLAENQSASTASKADYRVSTGLENDPEPNTAQARTSMGTEGDTGQSPIKQDPGWTGEVSTHYVDDNFHNSPASGLHNPGGPDQQGQLLRGYVLNGPDVTAVVESEGMAAQKGSMYIPRVNVLHDPNPPKAR